MSVFVNLLREDRERTIKKAWKEGYEIGRKEVIEEEKREVDIRIAKAMLKEKIYIDLIEKVTGLKRDEFI